jgi:adenine deaminase
MISVIFKLSTISRWNRNTGAYTVPLAKRGYGATAVCLSPGLINGHTHLESSILDVGQYARAVVTHGTSAVVTDLGLVDANEFKLIE